MAFTERDSIDDATPLPWRLYGMIEVFFSSSFHPLRRDPYN